MVWHVLLPLLPIISFPYQNWWVTYQLYDSYKVILKLICILTCIIETVITLWVWRTQCNTKCNLVIWVLIATDCYEQQLKEHKKTHLEKIFRRQIRVETVWHWFSASDLTIMDLSIAKLQRCLLHTLITWLIWSSKEVLEFTMTPGS